MFEGPLRRRLRDRLNPSEASDIEELRKKKAAEWKSKGYPEELIQHALSLADGWATSMAEAFGTNEAVKKEIIRGNYPKALENGEAWIKAMMK